MSLTFAQLTNSLKILRSPLFLPHIYHLDRNDLSENALSVAINKDQINRYIVDIFCCLYWLPMDDEHYTFVNLYVYNCEKKNKCIDHWLKHVFGADII